MATFDRTKHIKNLRKGPFVSVVDNNGKAVEGVSGNHGVVERSINGESVGIDRIEVSPGSGFEMHTHPSDHILYVLRGRGFLDIQGEAVEMTRGMSLFVPANVAHAMRAAPRRWLKVLAIGFPHIDLNDPKRMVVVRKGTD